jgi:uncharacterized membrane protein YkvA (DUF1232 family)
VGNYLIAIFCFIYILNPGMGVFELIPDNIPFVGNLDEAAMSILMYVITQKIIKKRK